MRNFSALFILLFCSLNYATEHVRLSQCAVDLLDANKAGFQREVDEALTRREIPLEKAAKLSECYKICIALPGASRCAIPTETPALFGHQSNLTYQVYQVAEFLRDFHIDVGGRKNPIFGIKEVILTSSKLLRGIEYKGERLFIKIPDHFGAGYRPLSSIEIRRMWDDGKMFSHFSPLRSRWKYMNPVGSFRTGLRSGLRSAAKLAKEKIARLRASLADSPGAIAETVKAGQSMVDTEKIEERLMQRLRSASAEELERVLSNWEKMVSNEALAEGLLDAGLMQGAFESIPRDYTIVMRGLINVGNIHDIGVKIRLGHLKYVRISAGAPQIDVTVNGLINVYTIDNVQIALDFNRALETASLEEALAIP